MSDFKSRKQSVPKYLDEEGDFVSSYFGTGEGRKLYSVCIIQDDVLAGVAFLAAKGPYWL